MRRIDTTGLLGIALMGSYARQEAGKVAERGFFVEKELPPHENWVL